MGITVTHGPSMVPVGRLALATGQASYINRRRKEMQQQQMQQAEMRQRRQLENQRIAANFQQAQFNHMAGMQKVFVENQLQGDRDQKVQDWNVANQLQQFNNQKELADMTGQRQLDYLNQQHNLMDQRQAANHQTIMMDQALDRIYKTANTAGKAKIDELLGQLAEAKDDGAVNPDQYRQARADVYSQIQDLFTGEDSAMYKIGAEELPGGEKIIMGGAYKQVVQQDGTKINIPNFDDGEGNRLDWHKWRDKYKQEWQVGNFKFMSIPDGQGGFQDMQLQSNQDVMDAAKMMHSNQQAQQKMVNDYNNQSNKARADQVSAYRDAVNDLMSNSMAFPDGITPEQIPEMVMKIYGIMPPTGVGTNAQRARMGLGGGGNVMSAGESFDAAMAPARPAGNNLGTLPDMRNAINSNPYLSTLAGAKSREQARAASIPDATPTAGYDDTVGEDLRSMRGLGGAGRGSFDNPHLIKSREEIEAIKAGDGGWVKIGIPGLPMSGKMFEIKPEHSSEIAHHSMVPQILNSLNHTTQDGAAQVSRQVFGGLVPPSEIMNMKPAEISRRAVKMNYDAGMGKVRNERGQRMGISSARPDAVAERDPHGVSNAMKTEEEQRLREQRSAARTALPSARSGWQSDVFGL